MASEVQLKDQLPPPIPKVEANVTPLYLILERQAIHVYQQLTQFIKTLSMPGHSDVQNKRKFLELLVGIRENFVRLYVLSKWARNSHSIQKLVDLFVWLREQNQSISNVIAQLGSIKESLVRAKIPNPDLNTALEVLIKGRPQLPLHDLLPEKPITPDVILKTLKNLNIELSTRMALQDELPPAFYKYKVQNGRVTFKCANSFEASISIANDSSDDVAFFLVDFKLAFASKENILTPSTTTLPWPTLFKLEQHANTVLSKTGLVGLYNLLHTYSITCKLYLLHRQLMDLRMGLWKGHIAHTYNAEKCIVVITYWLKRNSSSSTIEIGKVKETDDLGFRWIKDGRSYTDHNLSLIQEDGTINIELLIRSVIKKHIDLIILETQQKLIEKVENAENLTTIYVSTDEHNNSNSSTSLIVNITHNKSVVLGIDELTGGVYFQNPTPLMNQIAQSINADPKKTVVRLLSLRLETQLFELSSILHATGWVNAEAVNLNNSLPSSISKLNVSYESLKDKTLANQLLTLKFYRRRDWPSGWFLTVGVSGFSSTIQWWVSRIKSSAGQWSVIWAEPLEMKCKESQYDYQGLLNLVSISTSRLLSNMIIQELEDQGAKVKQLDRSLEKTKEFMKFTFDITVDAADKDPLLVISNNSLCNIPNCHEALVLSVTTTNDTMEILLFGKLKGEFKSSVSFVDKSTSIDMNPVTSLFKIKSVVNTKLKFLQQPFYFLSDLLAVLNKLSGLLTLLQMINNDSKIKVTDVSLNNVSFQYGEKKTELISLILLNDEQMKLDNQFVSLELPPGNPHSYCIDQLRYLLNTSVIKNDIYDMDIFRLSPKGVKTFIKFLKFTLPFFVALKELFHNRELEVQNFFETKGFDDPQRSLNTVPLSTYEINYYETTMFSIDYYRVFEKTDDAASKRKKKASDKPSITKIDRSKTTLKVELKCKGDSFTAPNIMFVFSASVSNNATMPEFLSKAFKGENLPKTSGSVVALETGLICDYKSVYEMIHFLHSNLKTDNEGEKAK